MIDRMSKENKRKCLKTVGRYLAGSCVPSVVTVPQTKFCAVHASPFLAKIKKNVFIRSCLPYANKYEPRLTSGF